MTLAAPAASRSKSLPLPVVTPTSERTAIAGVMTSEEVIRTVRARQAVTLLAFSAGKDSVAAWLAIREHFDGVVPVYRYLIPDLEFVDEALAYYERFFGTRIRRFPHPSLYRMWSNLVYQPPENCLAIEERERGWSGYDYVRSNIEVCRDAGIPETTLCASGVRAADSPMRRVHFRKHGPITESTRAWYPVWDYTKAGYLAIMQRAGVKVPIDYRFFGRSFDGIDYRFLAPIRKHFPRDYRRILEFFPLAELELFRFERSAR
jgi:hypothetical protein